MPMFQRAGMREGGEPLPQVVQYLILVIWRHCAVNLVIISLLASKRQDFKLKCLFFSHFMKWMWRPLISKSWHFAANEDMMTKFNSQGLHIIRIKFWNACWSGSPPSLIPTLWNTLGKHFRPECISFPLIFCRQTLAFGQTHPFLF